MTEETKADAEKDAINAAQDVTAFLRWVEMNFADRGSIEKQIGALTSTAKHENGNFIGIIPGQREAILTGTCHLAAMADADGKADKNVQSILKNLTRSREILRNAEEQLKGLQARLAKLPPPEPQG